jgi:hypothetical protein
MNFSIVDLVSAALVSAARLRPESVW